MIMVGHIRNGVVVLDRPNSLPEGASVRVELVAATPEPPPRRGGQYAGRIWMAPDFDEWPNDLQEALGMKP